jgi:hypothetical protein
MLNPYSQITPTGITLCDEFAVVDLCKGFCQTDSAKCAFNGVCLCRKSWDLIFNLQQPFIRKEDEEDDEECSYRCSMYHHDYVGRIYDTKMKSDLKNVSEQIPPNSAYKFREKFCFCGEWLNSAQLPKSQVSQENANYS